MKNTLSKSKAIFTVLFVLLITTALIGCSAQKDENPKMNIDYGKRDDGTGFTVYNGEAQEFFGVADGKENAVDVTVKKESGSLRITIHKENDPDSIVYDGHDFPNESFTVTVKEPGRYRILVHAEEFVGSYKFSYDMGQ